MDRPPAKAGDGVAPSTSTTGDGCDGGKGVVVIGRCVSV